jgi:hypothetical protein
MFIRGVRTQIWSELIRLHKKDIEAPLNISEKYSYSRRLSAKLAHRKARRPVPVALFAALKASTRIIYLIRYLYFWLFKGGSGQIT